MSRKRFAPLINVGTGLLAIGETVGRAMTGDEEGALDSALAAGRHLFSGLVPYVRKDSGINRFSAILNGVNGIWQYADILNKGKVSKSVSYNALPIISFVQMGTNATEYIINDKMK
jgi:hypothetical protein